MSYINYIKNPTNCQRHLNNNINNYIIINNNNSNKIVTNSNINELTPLLSYNYNCRKITYQRFITFYLIFSNFLTCFKYQSIILNCSINYFVVFFGLLLALEDKRRRNEILFINLVWFSLTTFKLVNLRI